jgi:Tfp pilus assembly protein PilV
MARVPHFRRRPLGPGRLSDTRGLTLVEVVCAAFVMLFAITSSMVAMQYGFRAIDTARGITVSSQILQSEIENIRLMAWNDISLLSPEKDLVYPPGSAESELTKLGFKITRYVTTVDDDLKEITITAEWTGVDGKPHMRKTTTRYCRNGLNDFLATDPAR